MKNILALILQLSCISLMTNAVTQNPGILVQHNPPQRPAQAHVHGASYSMSSPQSQQQQQQQQQQSGTIPKTNVLKKAGNYVKNNPGKAATAAAMTIGTACSLKVLTREIHGDTETLLRKRAACVKKHRRRSLMHLD